MLSLDWVWSKDRSFVDRLSFLAIDSFILLLYNYYKYLW